MTATIVAPRTVDQLITSLHATDVDLSDETLQGLDDMWPGPGGEAPQAYV